MTLTEYADILNINLVLTYYHNQDNRWSAKLERIEVKDGSILARVYGNGNSPEEAQHNYAERIKGRHVVQNAYAGDRREFNVPDSITG